jgi:hypothetical protein
MRQAIIALWRKRRRLIANCWILSRLHSPSPVPASGWAKRQAPYPLIIAPPRSRPFLSYLRLDDRRLTQIFSGLAPTRSNLGRCWRHNRPSSNANRSSRYTPAPKCQEIVRASCSSVRSCGEQCRRNSATLAPQCVCGRGPSGSCPARAAPQTLSRAGNTGTALNASRPLRRSMIHSRQASL